MRRREWIHWATFIIVALFMATAVIAYGKIAFADIEQQSTHSLLLSPQSRASAKLLHDKTLEL